MCALICPNAPMQEVNFVPNDFFYAHGFDLAEMHLVSRANASTMTLGRCCRQEGSVHADMFRLIVSCPMFASMFWNLTKRGKGERQREKR